MLPMSTTDSMQVAATILEQLGGARCLTAMLGAKNFLGSKDALQFRFAAKAKNGANSIRVVLAASDTYTVEFWAIRGVDCRKVDSQDDVYADVLRSVIEYETGLYLSL